MGRVFVSCADRDRAAGDRLAHVLRILGHEPVDDRDASRGRVWWNEVVIRIESTEAFLAVVTPAYVEERACRLAAKHAAESGLRIVRIDMGEEISERETRELHPIVATAVRLHFELEDDTWAAARLGAALDDRSGQPAPPRRRRRRWRWRGPRVHWGPRLRRATYAALVAVLVLGAVVLVPRLLDHHRGHGKDRGAAVEAAPPAPTTADDPDAGQRVQLLLDRIAVLDSPRLPASACRAEGAAIVCTRPARHIWHVRLTTYPTRTRLYDAYTTAVTSFARGQFPENLGDCTRRSAEGEVAWNLGREHRRDLSIAEQRLGGLDPGYEAAGRVFCTAAKRVVKLAWTEDPALVVTASGRLIPRVLGWWRLLHLELACASRGSAVGPVGCAGLIG